MEQPKINYAAVLVAAAIQFAVGWLWYGVLFLDAWMRAQGLTMETMQPPSGGEMALMYGGSFVAYAVVYYVMAHFVSYTKATTAMQGAQTGFWSWLGYTATVLFVTTMYSMKPFSLWLIDGGYWLISMLIGGVLLALWKKKGSAEGQS